MIGHGVTFALLLLSAACFVLAGIATSALIDQPWNEVREPILSDATNIAIFSAVTVLCLSAAIALLALFIRRVRVRGHGLRV